MKFCQQLSSYLRTKEYTGNRLYGDMFEQAVLCDQGGYDSVALTEHHLINILMMPAPLQFAGSEERRVGKECRSRWSPYH